MINRFASLLFLAAAVLASGLPALSQQASERKPTPAEIQRFMKGFQTNVVKGCLQNPPKDLRKPAGYCNCYAKSFVTRYEPFELATISNLAGAAPQNAQIISVMMSPDQRLCRAAN
jgi:hypothetical protein